MIELLLAVALYVGVFGIDYLYYVKQKDAYNYVSRRTYVLFMSGQFIAIWLFYDLFMPFLAHVPLEFVMISIFAGLLFLFTYVLTKDRILVCSLISRTVRCLTPYYVFVKGAEIVFQQMIYLVIALSLASLLGVHFLTYLAYVAILLVTHIVVILGDEQSVIKSLTFGLFAISIPIFYIFCRTRYILACNLPARYNVRVLLGYLYQFRRDTHPETPQGGSRCQTWITMGIGG